MRYGILLLLAAFLAASSAQGLFDIYGLEYYVDKYNANIDQAPGFLRTILGNERVEILITLDNGSTLDVGLETDWGSVVSVSYRGISDPSIVVDTTEQAIHDVILSADPIERFLQSRERGDISITANTIPGKIKLSTLLSSMDVLKFFYQRVFTIPT